MVVDGNLKNPVFKILLQTTVQTRNRCRLTLLPQQLTKIHSSGSNVDWSLTFEAPQRTKGINAVARAKGLKKILATATITSHVNITIMSKVIHIT